VRTIDESDVVATFEVDEPTAMQPTQFDGLGVYLGGMMSVEGERATLGEQHARADDLIRTLRALPEATDAEALGQHLARAAIDMIDGSGCVVTVWEREVGTVVAAEGDAPAIGTTFGVSESETALAARAGATLLRERFARGALPIVASRERFAVAPKAVVAVPLKIRREVCGVLTAWSAHEIPQHGIHDLETLAPYAALQLRHAREFGVMRSLAQHDALTGMNNRLAFEEFMAAETARYDRYQRPFAVVMIDIDHFKSVNDRYGHEAGDAVLRRVSDVVRGSLRGVDFSARIGGEEFVMVLPETGLEEAIEIAERMRQRVEALTVEWGGQVMDIRVSAGVAAIPECVRFPNQLLRSADAALYASKRDGRNRVTASALGKR
jgi:diguanylate cyclase (GGDEF)-like protein